MTISPIESREIEVALELAEWQNFEKYVHAYMLAVEGNDYIPLAPMHDGGADGIYYSTKVNGPAVKKFFQISQVSSHKKKIRQAVKDITRSRESPDVLIYCTNRFVSSKDIVQEELSNELDCKIEIRDKSYFVYQTDSNSATKEAYLTYLAPSIQFLKETGGSKVFPKNEILPNASLCVFLNQELRRTLGKNKLLESVSDSLILWALRDTDSTKGIFMSRDEIKEKVNDVMPSVTTFFNGTLNPRLVYLRRKTSNGRRINFHKKTNSYCLPHETKISIFKENLEDQSLKNYVEDKLRGRIIQKVKNPDEDGQLVDSIVSLCFDTIHSLFIDCGSELSVLLSEDESSLDQIPTLEETLCKLIENTTLPKRKQKVVFDIAMYCLNETIFSNNYEEKLYLGQLSRTYIVLFLLRNEPKIVEYFKSMSSRFSLYVGSDIIIRCLSENLDDSERQSTINALKMLKQAGSELILTEAVVEEVWSHIRASHFEFLNNFLNNEQYITEEVAKRVELILINAYFRAKFAAKNKYAANLTWFKFIDRFITPSEIDDKVIGKDEIREYLISSFGMEYEAFDDMTVGIERSEIEELSQRILEVRNKTGLIRETERLLCRNSALTILRVYGKRKQTGERNFSNPYGFKSWWLTNQRRLLEATQPLVKENGARYMIRLEFILSFLSLIPKQNQLIISYGNVFRSQLGTQLSVHMDDKTYQAVINELKEVNESTEPARVQSKISKLINNFVSDFNHTY